MKEHSRTKRVPLDLCPACAHPVDSISAPPGTEVNEPVDDPDHINLTVCLYCGTLLFFDAGTQQTRLLTDEERAALPPEVISEVNKIQHHIKHLDIERADQELDA